MDERAVEMKYNELRRGDMLVIGDNVILVIQTEPRWHYDLKEKWAYQCKNSDEEILEFEIFVLGDVR